MLIPHPLPIKHVYIKPGGQRGFSRHCINIPQNIRELAHSLPRYPKDLPDIVVQKKGKGNNKWCFRFASHQGFSYWALNMI